MKPPHEGSWLQVTRTAMAQLGEMMARNPKATATMLQIASAIGQDNALVISHANLAKMVGCSTATLKRALQELHAANWIEIIQIGDRGTVNAYVVNSAVAWTKGRDKLSYSKFHATVIASSNEQPRPPRKTKLLQFTNAEPPTPEQFTIEGEIAAQVERENAE